MKNLFKTALASVNYAKFVWQNQVPDHQILDSVDIDVEKLGGQAEWAKEQIKKETADNLGNLLETVLKDEKLTKEEVISLLGMEGVATSWSKEKSNPKDSARYVMALQAGLKMLGHDPGTIDALYGLNGSKT